MSVSMHAVNSPLQGLGGSGGLDVLVFFLLGYRHALFVKSQGAVLR